MTINRQTILLGLGALSALLAAAFVYLMLAPLAEAEIPQVQFKQRPKPVLAASVMAMPPPESFAEIDARPVFNPSRKPIAAPVAAQASETPPDITLVGVITDNQDRLALIRTPSAPFASAFRVGAVISGWQVIEIEPDRIVLSTGQLETRFVWTPIAPNKVVPLRVSVTQR